MSQHGALQIAEWQPTLPIWLQLVRRRAAFDFGGLGLQDVQAGVFLLVVLGLCVDVQIGLRRWRDYRFDRLLIAIAALSAAVVGIRFVWLTALAVFVAAPSLDRAVSTGSRIRRRVVLTACVCVAGLSLCALGRAAWTPRPWAASHIRSPYLPRDLCEFVAAAGLQGNLYNPYGWGGYCIYRLFPACRVFVDGRDHIYRRYDPTIFADAALVERGGSSAEAVLARREVQLILVRLKTFAKAREESGPNAIPTSNPVRMSPTLQRPPSGFICVFLNREGALFLRNPSPQLDRCVRFLAQAGIVMDAEYGFDPQTAMESSPSFAARYGLVDTHTAAALRRLQSEPNGGNARDLILVGDALLALACPRGAAAYLSRALQVAPADPHAMFQSARAAHRLGDDEKARELALRAFFLRPGHVPTRAFHQHMERYHAK